MNSPISTAMPMPAWLQPHLLQGMRRGIERETLRMQSDGYIAKTPHPRALGAALTHPHITTDYSEALLELITPPKESPQAVLAFLRDLHAVVQQHLPAGETLWPLSMPCLLDQDEQSIPLAQYGTSNIGQFKTLYRHGLGLRYGRRMQTIAGLHYNLSFSPEFFAAWQASEADAQDMPAQRFINQRYLGLIRNFIRLTPLVIYLLGASPAVCACFLTGRAHHLQPLMKGTLHLPHATGLRMGKLGYQNTAQRQLGIHYNDLAGYVAGVRQAIATPYPAFAALGLDDAAGQPLQVNDHVLQIENEYYSMVRPKQVAEAGESPAQALERRGIGYVELRAVDVDPYSDVGISLETACFLEVLALSALLMPSPALYFGEEERIARNQSRVVDAGRQADLMFELADGEVRFVDWAAQQLNSMQSAAEWLDQAHGGQAYRDALAVMQNRLKDATQTLSARILADTLQAGGSWRFGYGLAVEHAAALLQYPVPDALSQQFEVMADASLIQQQAIEQADQVSFATYLQSYRQHTQTDMRSMEEVSP
ncbi:MAG: glutamate--cysteine ligase [Pseudomonadota bacterium]|nr:glutamate--cysteine ligase [Pseudomonadota bacterium]